MPKVVVGLGSCLVVVHMRSAPVVSMEMAVLVVPYVRKTIELLVYVAGLDKHGPISNLYQ